jgi:hypothetical protein
MGLINVLATSGKPSNQLVEFQKANLELRKSGDESHVPPGKLQVKPPVLRLIPLVRIGSRNQIWLESRLFMLFYANYFVDYLGRPIKY